MKHSNNGNDGRNYGIDALRLFSMFLIVIMHVLGQGGILNRATGHVYRVGWLFESFAYCSVNCFAIISGYVSYSEEEKPFRYSRYASLWLQTFFYSLGITLIASIWNHDLLYPKFLIFSAMPVASSHYWYFTAYTGVFFLTPWLNKLVRSCSPSETHRLVVICFVLFSGYAIIGDYFGGMLDLDDGYSFLWLAILYLFGAWMKKCSITEQIGKIPAAECLIVCTMITWTTTVFLDSKLLLSYISPTVLLAAVAMVILFSKLHIGTASRRVLRCFAPAAFGVYLIHVHSVCWEFFMRDRFASIAESPAWLMVLQVIGCSSGIFLVCLLIEKLRLLLFRALRIDTGITKLLQTTGRIIGSALKL